ncbi:metallophosphoesterase family protein [Seramator thermalis]|uniref:metallophosphoesterase family protein n=1 Tax=Seramator thermalis TaxID=2496270 RepID=UPI00101D7E03|nr:metallophosphoesterase [Seramator thermalis]
MKRSLICFFVLLIASTTIAHEQSFLVLGDIHYDRMEDHDMTWLSKKPDDLRQVKEYTQITKEVWPVFSSHLRQRTLQHDPAVKAVVQLGDLSERLAGSEKKADQMARAVVTAVEAVNMPVPWIIIKGNHDITGLGAVEAFHNHYIPLLQKQLKRNDVTSSGYAHQIGENLFVAFDPWDKSEGVLDQLDKNLSSPDARFKFLIVHVPVIPINERCWYLYRDEPRKRERLLEIIARNGAVVLTTRLHLYSIVRRETDYEPVVQLSFNSVVRDLDRKTSDKVHTRYGQKLATDHPECETSTLIQRIHLLHEESRYVSFFKQQDLAGYGLITTNPYGEEIFLEYHAGVNKTPYERICISDLLK